MFNLFKKKEQLSLIDMVSEEYDGDIVVYDDRNKKIAFEKIAGISFDDTLYLILRPRKRVKGMAKNEALVFSFDVNDVNPEGALNIVVDDDIIDRVFERYNELLDAQY